MSNDGQKEDQIGAKDTDTQVAEDIVAATDNPIVILGLAEPSLNALGKISWLPDEENVDRAIIKAFRSRVLHVHPDRSKIGHEPLAIQAYCLLQEARDLLLDVDKRKVQLDAWQTVLKNRKPEGWVPARVSSTTSLAASAAERQRLRRAELDQRQAEAKRRTEAEFKKRMVVAKANATKKRSRPVMKDSALYSSGSESSESESESDQEEHELSAGEEMKRAMAVRERQKQRRRR